jgi:uncharacterized membrane protein
MKKKNNLDAEPAPMRVARDPQVEENRLVAWMLTETEDALYAKNRTNEFVESLRAQFEQRGYLTARQIESLKTIYERVTVYD